MAVRTKLAFYFGCVRGLGHYLWSERLHMLSNTKSVGCPWPYIDCRLQPGCDLDSASPKPPAHQPQSVGRLHHREGWTAVAFWDRSADRRMGSNSTFLFDEVLDFDAAIARARSVFPDVCARMELLAPLTEWVGQTGGSPCSRT